MKSKSLYIAVARAEFGTLRLAELPATAVDCQTSGARPPEDRIIELAWQCCRGGTPVRPADSSLVALPDSERLSSRVSRLTGIDDEALAAAPDAAAVWSRFVRDAASVRMPDGRDILIAHFAGFEARFLTDWYGQLAPERPPPIFLCTYEIGRRLFPTLPKHTLRALSGYFGRPLSAERRALPHVEATAAVWQRLVDALLQRGVEDLESVARFLCEKPEKVARIGVFEMPKSLAEGVPDSPGVYRFLDARGAPLYVGKARRLKTRVRSYFQNARRKSGHIREMIGQIADAELTPLASALEAAMLEAAEIKRLRPPYNRKLNGAERPTVYFSADWTTWTTSAGEGFPRGPFTRPEIVEDLLRLSLLAKGTLPESPLSEAFGELTIDAVHEGLALWPSLLRRPVPETLSGWIAVGWVLDALREREPRASESSAADGAAPAGEEDEAARSALRAFRRILGAATRAAREWKRGRTLRMFGRCAAVFALREDLGERRRAVVFEAGRAVAAETCESMRESEDFLARNSLFEVAGTAPVGFVDREMYDMIGVLLGELRRLVRSGRPVAIYWGERAPLRDGALKRLLEAV